MRGIPLRPGSCARHRWLWCTSSQLQARATNKADLTHLPECAESLLGLDFACSIDDSGVRCLNLLACATNQADLTHLPEWAESLLSLDLARGIDDSGVRRLNWLRAPLTKQTLLTFQNARNPSLAWILRAASMTPVFVVWTVRARH